MPLPWDPANGDWIVNGFGMVTPAMKPMDLEKLWAPAPLDGADVDLYGMDGDLEREEFETGVTHMIRMQLVGDVTHAGAPTAHLKAGTAANYAAVCTALHKSTWGGRSCSTVVERPDGVNIGNPVKVSVGPIGKEVGPVSQFTVAVKIPKGFLAVIP